MKAISVHPSAMEARVQDDKPYPFAPFLAVEVASPLQTKRDMAAKVARYLRGGTRLVWVVYPHTRHIDVWHQGDEVPTVTLQPGDILDGEDVVPGFRVPVTPLFD